MNGIPRSPRAALLAAAAVLTLLTAASACGQQPTPEGGQRAASQVRPGSVPADSVVPRAQRSRSKGAEQAPVTIVEISDFQCPFCRQWTEQTYAKLDSAYIQTGKVRMLFIHYPLPNHAEAFAASEASMCAGAQGKFWEMHDRLFATQREWSGQPDAVARFEAAAEALKLDMDAYRDCTENDRVASLIVNDVMSATSAGVQGTPTFILNGQQAMSGAVSFEEMSRQIDALLANPAPQRPQAPPQQQPAPAPAQP